MAIALVIGGVLASLTACQPRLSPSPKPPPPVSRQVPAQHPFGSRPHPYAEGTLLPSVSEQERDRAVEAFYDYWADKYLKPGCSEGQLLVEAKTKPQNLTVSEAHGYGMVILAYMAGYDPQAKSRFDAMARYHHAHPSKNTPGLMAWSQNQACKDAEGKHSATAGDLDIGYAYLLADAQWGSSEEMNYAETARWVLSAVSARGLHGRGIYPLLGDWVTPAERPHYWGARTSDFMTGHFRSFASATEDPVWLGLRDNTYWIIETLQLTTKGRTGLLPDFAQNLEQTPTPAEPGFLEGARDGSYAENACRIPLRLGADYVVSGDPRAARILRRLNRFAKKASGGDPLELRGGYELDGAPLVDYETMAFSAPLAVGAMAAPNAQEWLDALWAHVVRREPEQYYEDTLRLLSMIVLSGNWWAPEAVRATKDRESAEGKAQSLLSSPRL